MLSTAVAAPPPFSSSPTPASRRRGADPGRLRRAPRRARVVACPPGPLATAARDAGLRVAPVRPRALVLRAGTAAAVAHAAGLSGWPRRRADRRRRTLARRRGLGMRAVLAAAPPRLGVPVLAVHNDLVPPGTVGAAVRTATRRCAGAVALSHAIAADLPGEPLSSTPASCSTARRPRRPPAGRPRVLWIGALVPWKRPSWRSTSPRCCPRRPSTWPAAPRPATGRSSSRRYGGGCGAARSAGRVRLLGRVAPRRVELAAAHALLHTADEEPFGMVLVEALAAGRPVVAPAAAGPLEIVGGDGGGPPLPAGRRGRGRRGAARRARLTRTPRPPPGERALALRPSRPPPRRFAAAVAELRATDASPATRKPARGVRSAMPRELRDCEPPAQQRSGGGARRRRAASSDVDAGRSRAGGRRPRASPPFSVLAAKPAPGGEVAALQGRAARRRGATGRARRVGCRRRPSAT